jgi:hypothetical protein
VSDTTTIYALRSTTYVCSCEVVLLDFDVAHASGGVGVHDTRGVGQLGHRVDVGLGPRAGIIVAVEREARGAEVQASDEALECGFKLAESILSLVAAVAVDAEVRRVQEGASTGSNRRVSSVFFRLGRLARKEWRACRSRPAARDGL